MKPQTDVHFDEAELLATLRADVALGLTDAAKWLPPHWFYDEQGCHLFDEITRQPEYYPTRCEREILTAHAEEIAFATGVKTLVELGSGSSDKTRLLLDAFTRQGSLGAFAPIDIAAGQLRSSVDRLGTDYPGLELHGVVAEFTGRLDRLPEGGDRMVALLGGTLGNLLPGQRGRFLTRLRTMLDPGEWLLVGVDLVKDPDILVAAYDDDAGITARFNRNVLHVINHRLGADFEPDAFEHRVEWDEGCEWIEMRLRATRPMNVSIPGADLAVGFWADEEVSTEVAAKFRPEGIAAELSVAGFEVRGWWTDDKEWFGTALAEAI